MAEEITVETPEVTPEPAGEMGAFYSALSPENQAHASAEKFKTADMDTVFKSYMGAESMVGRDKIVLPKQGDADDVARYYTDRGGLDSPEAYDLKGNEWSQSVGYDPSVVATLAQKLGMTPDEARVAEDYVLADAKANYDRQEQEAVDLRGKNEQQLRTEYGDKFDDKMGMKEAIIDKFARTPEVAKALRAFADADPLNAASLADIAGKFSEHSIGEFQPKSMENTPQEANAKMDAMRADKDGPYWNDDDRVAHDNAYHEYNRLAVIAAGGR